MVASESGPVAFVEAEHFGGQGTQSAIVWRGGAVVLGPLHTQTHDGEEDGYITSSDLAINQVFRVLGVSIAGAHDEFDALGLGRFRETGEWAALSSGRLDT